MYYKTLNNSIAEKSMNSILKRAEDLHKSIELVREKVNADGYSLRTNFNREPVLCFLFKNGKPDGFKYYDKQFNLYVPKVSNPISNDIKELDLFDLRDEMNKAVNFQENWEDGKVTFNIGFAKRGKTIYVNSGNGSIDSLGFKEILESEWKKAIKDGRK